MRVRRVAGIIAFALALALGLMLQATDPVVAAPPPQTPDDADQLSHDTEEILVEPEEVVGRVGYTNPDYVEYTDTDTLGSVDRTTFDAFGTSYVVVELSQTADNLTIHVTPCPTTWEIASLTLGAPSEGTGRPDEVVIGDSSDEASQLTLDASVCSDSSRWVVDGVPTDAIQAGHGTIAATFRVRSTNVAKSAIADDFKGLRSERGLRSTICSLPSAILGPGACAPLMIFGAPLAVIGGMFLVGGVRNPMILAGAGLVAMSGMSALVLPSPVMIAGFVVASLGVTATLLLLRR